MTSEVFPGQVGDSTSGALEENQDTLEEFRTWQSLLPQRVLCDEAASNTHSSGMNGGLLLSEKQHPLPPPPVLTVASEDGLPGVGGRSVEEGAILADVSEGTALRQHAVRQVLDANYLPHLKCLFPL